ncbi:MAG: sporulation protein YqfD, partial [Clostridia bacterium]|nr:sporulation protein YqfD [Clostridia bacterium]
MIINLLRLILGFVEFEAKGGFSERFLNLCTINGITLWNVINDGVKVKACTDIKSYKRIRKSAHNSGMRVRITAKHGLPFFVKNNKARVGILIGAVLAVSFLAFSSCVIWDVEISGNDYVKSEALLESLEKNGVRVGALKGDIDTVSIAENLLEEYPEISWASINIFGTKAALEVKENTKKPDIINSDKPTNVVARKDGQILLVQGYRGTNAVKEGDVVVKGDLLISGITLMADGSEKLVHSFGKVYANTISRFDGEEALKKDVKLLKNAGVNYKIYLLGLEIPLYFRCEGKELYS